MKIALIGYGKMGKAIERLARARGHEIIARIDAENVDEVKTLQKDNCDVAIEFSQPEKAFDNLTDCLKNGVSVISGTTGWLERLSEVEDLAKTKNGAFLHASNFSVGVNIFFMLNEFLAEKMKTQKQFRVEMTETHHTEKLDAPSGTAVKLAEGIMAVDNTKKGWINETSENPEKISIISHREPNVPGTHTVNYASEMESIEIKHTANNRDIFAAGALDVAEWISNKTGVFTMKDYLKDLH